MTALIAASLNLSVSGMPLSSTQVDAINALLSGCASLSGYMAPPVLNTLSISGSMLFGGRLSLASGSPLSEASTVGATNVYYVSSSGNTIPIYNGTFLTLAVFPSQLILPLDNIAAHAGYHQSGKIFDLLAVNDAGTIRIGSGPAWASDTSRGMGAGTTELECFSGMMVNKNSIPLRFGNTATSLVSVPPRQATYLGSFRATADGQASDSKLQRLLFNAYNVVLRPIFVGGGVSSYSYNGTAWQSLAGSGLKAEFLLGLSGTMVSASATAMAASSTTTYRLARIGIGLDSFTAPADSALITTANLQSEVVTLVSQYVDYPGLGYHYLAPLEITGGGPDTITWYPYAAGVYRNGLIGSFLN